MVFNEKKTQSVFYFVLPMFFWPHSGAYNGALSEEMVEGISDSALFTQPRLRGHFLKVQ